MKTYDELTKENEALRAENAALVLSLQAIEHATSNRMTDEGYHENANQEAAETLKKFGHKTW